MNEAEEQHQMLLCMQICDHFVPVMHHWFLENFRHPAQWFERRLNYTRSVAVNSMAGDGLMLNFAPAKLRKPLLILLGCVPQMCRQA